MINPIQLTTIKELYKCHFTTNEVSDMTGHSYAIISNLYRSFKIIKLYKYDRFELANQADIDHEGIIIKPKLYECIGR